MGNGQSMDRDGQGWDGSVQGRDRDGQGRIGNGERRDRNSQCRIRDGQGRTGTARTGTGMGWAVHGTDHSTGTGVPRVSPATQGGPGEQSDLVWGKFLLRELPQRHIHGNPGIPASRACPRCPDYPPSSPSLSPVGMGRCCPRPLSRHVGRAVSSSGRRNLGAKAP